MPVGSVEGLSWGPRILVGATIPRSALGRGTLAVWRHPQRLLHTPKRGNLDQSGRGCVRSRAEGGGERLEGPEPGGSGSGAEMPHQGQFTPPNGGITPVLSWVGDGHMAEATA